MKTCDVTSAFCGRLSLLAMVMDHGRACVGNERMKKGKKKTSSSYSYCQGFYRVQYIRFIVSYV